MQSNISYERNERTNRQARKQAAQQREKPQYPGKQWTRGNDKREHVES